MLNYEALFYETLCALVEHNGGSLSEALDELYITEEQKEVIRKELDWDEEEEDED